MKQGMHQKPKNPPTKTIKSPQKPPTPSPVAPQSTHFEPRGFTRLHHRLRQAYDPPNLPATSLGNGSFG
ncbi:hypothetical protein TK49_02305 [Ralstonia mannitolilytica]|nr:hypothetical protein TK49_02305 [Ralstonia mannitolilytica]